MPIAPVWTPEAALHTLRAGTEVERIEARTFLAGVFEQRGMYDEAVDLLEANARAGIRNADIFRSLSRLYRALGDPDTAAQAAAEAAKYMPPIVAPAPQPGPPLNTPPPQSQRVPQGGYYPPPALPPRRYGNFQVAVFGCVAIVLGLCALGTFGGVLREAIAPVAARAATPTPAATPPSVAKVEALATAAPVAAAATAVPTAPQSLPESAVTVEGSGISKSRPFYLAGGNYTMRWTATPKSRGGCFHGGELKSLEQSSVSENVGHEFLNDDRPRNGETQAYRLKAGNYYLDMSSGCDWKVVVSPLR